VPQALFAASFRTLSAKTVGVLATLLPFYGTFWGYVFHGETVTARTVLGGAIILACVVYETLRSVRGDAPPQRAAVAPRQPTGAP
jgi:drug/metabolite transporter (DMT)-like permease